MWPLATFVEKRTQKSIGTMFGSQQPECYKALRNLRLTQQQSALVSIVVGAMAAVFGIYAGTSGQSKKFKGED